MDDGSMPPADSTDQAAVSGFLNRVFFHPLDYAGRGAVDAWPALFTRGYEILERLSRQNPEILPLEQMVDCVLNLTRHSKLMYYTAAVPLRGMLEARARCAEAYLAPRMPGAAGWKPERRVRRPGAPADLAVYMKTFAAYTETFASLPFFQELDPCEFAVTVYVDNIRDGEMARAARARGANIVVLEGNLLNKLARVRAGNHDTLLITSNTSAVVSEAFIFGLFRAARRQLVQFCQPYTTGLPGVDGFIVGRDLQVRPEDFSEELLPVDGSGVCFAPGAEEEPSAGEFSREAFNIPRDAVVFVSGANYYKIKTELMDFWARMLAENPGTALVLFPFGPAWSSQYPAEEFMARLRAAAEGRGVAPGRFVVCKPLPKRADIRRLIGLCDIYVDSFPYSGATSLLDPFFLRMPIVAMGTRTVCGGQGAGMLRECGLGELAAADEEGYMRLCRRLARDPSCRAEISARLARVMDAPTPPPFHDLAAFARKVGGFYRA